MLEACLDYSYIKAGVTSPLEPCERANLKTIRIMVFDKQTYDIFAA